MAGVTVADHNFVSEKSCTICGTLENLKRCGKCRSIWYCSREHQTQDWKNHKKKCKELQQKTESSIAPNSSEAEGTCKDTHDDDTCSAAANVTVKEVCKETSTSTTAAMTANVDPKSKSKKSKTRKKKKSKSGDKPSEDDLNQDAPSSSISVSDMPRAAAPSSSRAVDSESVGKSDSQANYDPRPYRKFEFPVPENKKNLDSLAKHIAEYLRQDDRCIVNDLLPVNAARAIRVEVEKLHERGSFVDGPLSGGKTSSNNSKKYSEKAIRSDKITWLQGNESNYPNICHFMKHLDCLVQKLNFYLSEEYEINGRTKAMVACYPGNGTGYAYHVDNPNKDGRVLTFLFYLNEGWDVEKVGGLLRLLPPSGDYVDVEPILNRLLVFWSDRRNPHEVQPAWASRYAITMWYFDREERATAKAAQLNEDIRNTNNEMLQLDVKTKTSEKASLEKAIEKQSENVVGTLSEDELEALAVLVESSSNPRHTLTTMKIAPQIQDALMRQLEERNRNKMVASATVS